METTSWQEVALAALNVAQVIFLAVIAARQQSMHSRVNGSLDDWLLRRERNAQRAPQPPPPPLP